jgi:CheY-like chemotaxis protein
MTLPVEKLSADQASFRKNYEQQLEAFLRGIVEAYRGGSVLREQDLESCFALRKRFCEHRLAVVESAQRLGARITADVEQVNTLKQLEEIIELAQESVQRERRRVEEANLVLARLLGVQHRDNPEFKPLIDIRQFAEMLQARLDATGIGDDPELESLLSAQHPLCTLLCMVEDGDSLSDQEWSTAQDVVSGAYGPELAIAAGRGKLVQKLADAPKPASASPVAAPAAEQTAPEPRPAPRLEFRSEQYREAPRPLATLVAPSPEQAIRSAQEAEPRFAPADETEDSPAVIESAEASTELSESDVRELVAGPAGSEAVVEEPEPQPGVEAEPAPDVASELESAVVETLASAVPEPAAEPLRASNAVEITFEQPAWNQDDRAAELESEDVAALADAHRSSWGSAPSNEDCVICGEPSVEHRCPKCGCWLELGDLDAIFNNDGCDRAALDRALRHYESQPQHRERHRGLALALLNLHRPYQALPHLEALVGQRPDDPAAHTLDQLRSRKLVLMVEDDAKTNAVFARTLHRHGYNTLVAGDAFEVAPLARKIKTDLVLLNSSMPGMDGYTLANLLRSDETTRTIPIVMVTAETGLMSRMRSRFSGVDAFFTKPFDTTKLLSTLHRALTSPVGINDPVAATEAGERKGTPVA